MSDQDPKIQCQYDKQLPLDELVENPRNPNLHTEDQIDRIAAAIRWQGWRAPITISNQSGFIVAGHGRFHAAKRLKAKTVPVAFQDFESDAQEWAHMIADNRLSDLSAFDNSKLKELISEMDTGEIELEHTGYSTRELEGLMTQIFQGDEKGRTQDEWLEIFRNSSVRQITLIFDEETFNEMLVMIEDIRKSGGHSNNTDAVAAAIRAYEL
jgi:hypothetical protein